jgi:membrane protein DedA with SNARE-associated domain
MEPFLSPLLSYVLLYKYIAIFIVVYAGAIILPLPVNAMLLAVGAFANQGYFSFWASLVVAVIANTLGDITDYGITRKWGDWAIRKLRINRFKFFDHLKEELRTDAVITVFITRFAGSLSSITSLLAGLVGVPFSTFFFYDLLGNIIEPGAALTIGYAVGSYWSDFSGVLGILTGMVAVGVILFVLIRIQRRLAKKFSE